MPTLIQQYTSSVVAGFLARVEALKQLHHSLTKGELRELFVAEILNAFLTEQFGVGSGIVVNQAGTQSRQMDVIIYDKRALPPFIRAERLGVFPMESVIATVEVKSNMTAAEIRDASHAAADLKCNVFSPAGSIYPQLLPQMTPLCALVGFYGTGTRALRSLEDGPEWLDANAGGLDVLCLTGDWSWAPINGAWTGQMGDDTAAYEETKRFIAILVDNIVSNAERRLHAVTQQHLDWVGVYVRDQGLFPTQ